MDALDPAEAAVPICFLVTCFFLLDLYFYFYFFSPALVLFGVRIWGLGQAGKNRLRWMEWDGAWVCPLVGGWNWGLMQFMCILHGA